MSSYIVSVDVGEVEATSPDEAKLRAKELLVYLSESNDGSEVLANAVPYVYLTE